MYISVSNDKYIIDHFLIIENNIGWLRLALMLETGSGTKKIFRQVDHIHIADIRYQYHGYFGLLGIGNVGDNSPLEPFVVSNIKKLK